MSCYKYIITSRRGEFREREREREAMMTTMMISTTTMMINNNNNNKNSSENIRLTLDQLHSEALHTRSKANSARQRLIRLSETAENLRRQAATYVQSGKEDNARELLYQKKKVMEALDKSKARIELLDELSFKLSEAISANETRLIDNVTSNLDSLTDDASLTVRIVSPEAEDVNLNSDEISVDNIVEFPGSQELPTSSAIDFSGDITGQLQNESDVYTSLEGTTTYEDFIVNIDKQLNFIESELHTVLTVSTLVLGRDEKLKNLRVQQTLDILEGVRRIRDRISKIISLQNGYLDHHSNEQQELV